jgi:hypothetical protein
VYSGVLWFYSTNLGDSLILSESARSMVSDLCCLRGADSKGGGISKSLASLSNFLTTEYTEHTDKMEPNRRTVRSCFRVFEVFCGSLILR